jgi:hypothetical protein
VCDTQDFSGVWHTRIQKLFELCIDPLQLCNFFTESWSLRWPRGRCCRGWCFVGWGSTHWRPPAEDFHILDSRVEAQAGSHGIAKLAFDKEQVQIVIGPSRSLWLWGLPLIVSGIDMRLTGDVVFHSAQRSTCVRTPVLTIYWTVLNSTEQYCTVLNSTVQYCTVLNSNWLITSIQ